MSPFSLSFSADQREGCPVIGSCAVPQVCSSAVKICWLEKLVEEIAAQTSGGLSSTLNIQ